MSVSVCVWESAVVRRVHVREPSANVYTRFVKLSKNVGARWAMPESLEAWPYAVIASS